MMRSILIAMMMVFVASTSFAMKGSMEGMRGEKNIETNCVTVGSLSETVTKKYKGKARLVKLTEKQKKTFELFLVHSGELFRIGKKYNEVHKGEPFPYPDELFVLVHPDYDNVSVMFFKANCGIFEYRGVKKRMFFNLLKMELTRH